MRINKDKAIETALMMFTDKNWHCAESVLYGLLEGANISDKDAYITSMSGFNGGFGGTKNICGALSGAAAGAGCLLGRYGNSVQDISLCSQTCAKIYNAFNEHFTTVKCSELTKDYEFSAPERRTHCRNMVKFAVQDAADKINNAVKNYTENK